jgi:hypothetical protein
MLSLFILNIMRRRADGKPPPEAAATMVSMAKHPPRPRDPSQLGKLVVDIATGQVEDPDPNAGKDEKMAALGRKGGAKGGSARAANLTAEERSEAARRAAKARWAKAT